MIAICTSKQSTANDRKRVLSGGGTPAASSPGVSLRRARMLAITASTENRRPVGMKIVQAIRAPIATPPQFSANSMRLCKLVVITNDSTWNSRVRQPIRKQKKQKKQTRNQSADSSGSDDMKNNENSRDTGGRHNTVWFGRMPTFV